ncbi:MAG TPA: hypothetical protein VMV83_12350 [Rectinemataceae bacterium]|nr:hypothetical protein [Rectinemataceae bacterium]
MGGAILAGGEGQAGYGREVAESVQPRSGMVLYSARSRRAGGLSLGINLFPDGKRCSFDCAYCEVLPGPGGPAFSIAALESELASWAEGAMAGLSEGADRVPNHEDGAEPSRIPLDLAFAGDGEPTLSPLLGSAIESVAAARVRWPAVFGSAKMVLITNSTGFLDESVVGTLHGAVARHGLEIWAKLDAGTEGWYRRIDRRGPDFERLFAALLSFSRRSPVVIQSMFCAVSSGSPGEAPVPAPASEIEAWARRLVELAEGGALIDGLQVYTQSRASPHRLTSPLDDASLLSIARLASAALEGGRPSPRYPIPIRVFGRQAELDVPGGLP